MDAFLAAGAKHVYATLWHMGDLRTAMFMQQVYADAQHGIFGSVRRSMAVGETENATREELSVWVPLAHYR